jgi:hypothetical protein
MRIFFAHASNDDFQNRERLYQIDQALSRYGEVVTGSREATPELGSKQEHIAVYERERELLSGADAFVAEVSYPSLGVGYEIALAERHGLPILCLYQKRPDLGPLSVMMTGNRELRVFEYQSVIDIDRILRLFFR